MRIKTCLPVLAAVFLISTACAADESGCEPRRNIRPLINWMKSTQDPKTGFPLSFSILPGRESELYKRMGGSGSVTGVIERMIVNEGVSVYDTALYQMVLTRLGGKENLRRAFMPVKAYWEGRLGELFNIRAGGRPFQPYVYDTKNPNAVSSDLKDKGSRGFIFRIFNAKGKYNTADPLDGKTAFRDFPNWKTIHWEDWKPIAGENAWVVMAALHLYHKKYYDPGTQGYTDLGAVELRLSEELARAAMLLQAENGGVRMAPLGTFCNLLGIDNEESPEDIEKQLDKFAVSSRTHTGGNETAVDFSSPVFTWYYNEISTENNLSWHAAFRMLFEITGKDVYRRAQLRVQEYLKSVWSPKDNVFYQGAHFSDGQWTANHRYFATDVQNWAIVSLGPALIDKWFGRGAAYGIWQNTKTLSGDWDEDGQFLGVGFTREDGRICVEWTAGAIMAADILAEYYWKIQPNWAEEIFQDKAGMREGIEKFRFRISDTQEAYSYSSKRGWIPFGWFSHEPEVMSLVSTAWVVLLDDGFNPFYLKNDCGAPFMK